MNRHPLYVQPEVQNLPYLDEIVPPDAYDLITVPGQGYPEVTAAVTLALERGKTVYRYLQWFTSLQWPWPGHPFEGSPNMPWASWAYGRTPIDHSMIPARTTAERVRAWLQATHPDPRVGVFCDNFFPELAPWHMGEDVYRQLSPLKIRAYERNKRGAYNVLTEEAAGRPPMPLMTNGGWMSPSPAMYFERAGANKGLLELLLANPTPERRVAVFSIPSHEHWNLDWAIDTWLQHEGLALGFTSDQNLGMGDGITQQCYARAIAGRRAEELAGRRAPGS